MKDKLLFKLKKYNAFLIATVKDEKFACYTWGCCVTDNSTYVAHCGFSASLDVATAQLYAGFGNNVYGVLHNTELKLKKSNKKNNIIDIISTPVNGAPAILLKDYKGI